MKFGGAPWFMASMFGGGAVSAAAAAAVPSFRQERVNWEDFNYPPGLRVIHYNLMDVEDEDCRCAVRWVHASYLSALATLCLNLVAALVLASGGVPKKGVDVLYAFLNLLLFSVFGMYGFYMAYKGLATQNKRLCYQYLGIQAVLFLFMCVSMLAGGANFNGWLNLQRASDSEKLRGFWIAWTLAEASLWTLNVLVCVVGMQRVWALKKTGRPLSLSGAVSSSSRPAAGIGSFGRGGTGAASA